MKMKEFGQPLKSLYLVLHCTGTPRTCLNLFIIVGRRAVGILLEGFLVSNCVLYLLLSNGTNHNCFDNIVYIEPFKQRNYDG